MQWQNCAGTYNLPCKVELKLEMFMCCEYIERNVSFPATAPLFSPTSIANLYKKNPPPKFKKKISLLQHEKRL